MECRLEIVENWHLMFFFVFLLLMVYYVAMIASFMSFAYIRVHATSAQKCAVVGKKAEIIPEP